jgi:hypothetical protein
MGTIISDWGGIFELEIDRKARIMARVSRKPNIYIYIYPAIFLPLNHEGQANLDHKNKYKVVLLAYFCSCGGVRSTS